MRGPSFHATREPTDWWAEQKCLILLPPMRTLQSSSTTQPISKLSYAN
jgi:hypothetical protein